MVSIWERFKLWRYSRKRKLPRWFKQWLEDQHFMIDGEWECANDDLKQVFAGELNMIDRILKIFYPNKGS